MTVLSKTGQKWKECKRTNVVYENPEHVRLCWYLLGVKLTWGHAHKTRS